MNGLDFWGKDIEDPKTKLQYSTYVCALPEMIRLRAYLEAQLEEVRRSRLGKMNYDKQSWPYLQADANGKEYQLIKTLKLFTVD